MRFVFVTRARERAVALTPVRIRAELPMRWNLKTFRGSDSSYVYVRYAVARSEAI